MGVRTRFAPSPTGDLHLGGAWTALASWVVARREPGGAVVLRVEDIDPPRVVAGAEARIEQDLRWLGLDWDEGPARQSERTGLYLQAIEKLSALGLVYPCDCSRAELARSASAPHPGEELVYPGTCRALDPQRPMKRAPALRVRVPDEAVAYEDAVVGRVTQQLAREVGDFVLRRGDGVLAYQLAVVVDDAAMGITEVVRGGDLLQSTFRQLLVYRALGVEPPAWFHCPLVRDAEGRRLAKRHKALGLNELRNAGADPARLRQDSSHGTSRGAPTP